MTKTPLNSQKSLLLYEKLHFFIGFDWFLHLRCQIFKISPTLAELIELEKRFLSRIKNRDTFNVWSLWKKYVRRIVSLVIDVENALTEKSVRFVRECLPTYLTLVSSYMELASSAHSYISTHGTTKLISYPDLLDMSANPDIFSFRMNWNNCL